MPQAQAANFARIFNIEYRSLYLGRQKECRDLHATFVSLILSQVSPCYLMLFYLKSSISLQRDICSVDGSLPFLVGLLKHRSLDIVENSSGILRNMSNYIVTCDEAETHRCVSLIVRQGRLDKVYYLFSLSFLLSTNWNICVCGTFSSFLLGGVAPKLYCP